MSNAISDAEEFASLTNNAEIKKSVGLVASRPAAPDEAPDGQPAKPSIVTQWAKQGEIYRATSPTVRKLDPGCYDISVDQYGVFAKTTLPPTGLLLELPEMRSDHVISLVERFWDSEKDYKEGNEFIKGGAAYRCGVMLYGPPGSGKSCTIKIVSNKLIARGGTVFFADNHPAYAQTFLSDFARIERNRKCVVILEDFDSLIQHFGESNYLQLLDSAKTIDNVLFIATTNYPERLDPRIYNRPGRFSHVVKIGLPGEECRRAYLRAILKNHRDVEKIVSLTDGFSIDHLSSLVSAVYREKKNLDEEAARLRAMFKVPTCKETGTLGIA